MGQWLCVLQGNRFESKAAKSVFIRQGVLKENLVDSWNGKALGYSVLFAASFDVCYYLSLLTWIITSIFLSR